MKALCEFEGCKKRLGLVEAKLVCKCKKAFCAAHRGSDDHACSFDYKSDHLSTLMKTMSTPVVAAKVEII